MFLCLCLRCFRNTKQNFLLTPAESKTEWGLIRSVILPVINEIERPQATLIFFVTRQIWMTVSSVTEQSKLSEHFGNKIHIDYARTILSYCAVTGMNRALLD